MASAELITKFTHGLEESFVLSGKQIRLLKAREQGAKKNQ
jgi:hypothetical protein